jgi:hypothetical protein
MKDDVKEYLSAKGVPWEEVDDLQEVSARTRVLCGVGGGEWGRALRQAVGALPSAAWPRTGPAPRRAQWGTPRPPFLPRRAACHMPRARLRAGSAEAQAP